MAVNNIPIDGIPQNELLYWLRLPFQAVFIYWAWVYTQPDEDRHRASIIPYDTEDAK